MKFVEKMQTRYTTKEYLAGYKLTDEQINELKEILRLSPSSINSQPWFFQIIGDEELKERLAEVSYFNADRVRNCSHVALLSVYADLKTFEQERINELPERTQEFYRTMMLPQGEEVVTKWLEKQVYIALGVLLSACAVMDIDSTPMEGIDVAAYTKIQGQDKYRVLVAVALGKRSPYDFNRPEVAPKSRRTDVF